jgi:integrase/recombinase XerD
MLKPPCVKEGTGDVVPLFRGALVGELLLSRLATTWTTARLRRGEIQLATAKRHRGALTHFIDTVGDRPSKTLRRKHVEKWLGAMADAGWEATTRRTNYGIVRSFTAWLRDEHHLDRDPFRGLKAPRKERRVARPLDNAAVDTLLVEAPDARAVAVFALTIVCGLRAMEVAGARLQDWNRVTEVLAVRGKGGHVRHVPVPPVVASALDHYLASVGSPTSGPLIRSTLRPNEHLKPATISTYWSKWARGAGVKRAGGDGVSCHAGRHTAATRVFNETGDPRAVQLLLGHASLQHVMVYSAAIELERLREAMTA